ncbi:NUDIX domain-containing protein [uncultured Sphaerochaeta sp.]|uniref:NUDIX hydrolase n=1 Tax=uncultured Sphaerochaeta sp. TaxID=886478 RepID=UPI002A0A8FB7|nr:NUDIX domain-containing protein [uncultured Sphaerochaeta sp.]
MEYWDLYDMQRQPLGQVHQRSAALPEGTYHIVISVWTVNTKGEILLTLRSPYKDIYPNCWENTTGSVVAGESSKEGALRELREETGIQATEDELYFVDTLIKSNSLVDRYLVKKDVKISDLVLQKEETVAARWVPFAEFLILLQNKEIAFPVERDLQRVKIGLQTFLSKTSLDKDYVNIRS